MRSTYLSANVWLPRGRSAQLVFPFPSLALYILSESCSRHLFQSMASANYETSRTRERAHTHAHTGRVTAIPRRSYDVQGSARVWVGRTCQEELHLEDGKNYWMESGDCLSGMRHYVLLAQLKMLICSFQKSDARKGMS